MEDIKAIGFKMEYTLINYKVTFENLAYVEAKKRLVNGKYPEKVRLSKRVSQLYFEIHLLSL